MQPFISPYNFEADPDLLLRLILSTHLKMAAFTVGTSGTNDGLIAVGRQIKCTQTWTVI